MYDQALMSRHYSPAWLAASAAPRRRRYGLRKRSGSFAIFAAILRVSSRLKRLIDVCPSASRMTDDSPPGRSSACQAVESGGASRGLWSVVESLDLVRPIDWPTDHLDGRSYLLFRRQLEPRQ